MSFKAVRGETGAITDFEWTLANPAAVRSSGRPLSELLGHRLSEHYPESWPLGLFDRYARVVETGEPATHEQHFQRDGLPRWSMVSMVKLGDGLTVNYVDVTESRQAYLALRHTEQLANKIFEHSPVGLHIFDPDGTSRRFNEAQRRLFGMPGLDYGIGVYNMLTDKLANDLGVADCFRQVLAGQVVEHKDHVVELGHPENVWDIKHHRIVINETFFPIHDEQGDVAAVVIMAWDNTAWAEADRALRESEELYRKLAQSLHESENRLRQILEAMPVGVTVTSRAGKLLSVNLLARQLLYRGGTILPIVRAGTYEAYPVALLPTARALLGEISQTEDVEVLTPEGPVPLLLTGSPVVDAAGVPELAVTVFMDMTAQRQLAAAQSDFISTVSHELRTPFTSIRGSLALLVGGVAGPLPEKIRPLVEIALRNSERLLTLINDLLDIQRLESGNMELNLQELELTPLVEQALEDNNAFASQLGVTFRLLHGEAGLDVLVDPNRLLQLMANLLSNAAKFSPQQGTVEIGVERHAGWARVSVHDHGRGIPAEFRSRIFSRFAQADSSNTRERGGAGLGLSICKALIERMGGFIFFTTLIGEGTTFFFDLPLVGPAGRATAGG